MCVTLETRQSAQPIQKTDSCERRGLLVSWVAEHMSAADTQARRCFHRQSAGAQMQSLLYPGKIPPNRYQQVGALAASKTSRACRMNTVLYHGVTGVLFTDYCMLLQLQMSVKHSSAKAFGPRTTTGRTSRCAETTVFLAPLPGIARKNPWLLSPKSDSD
jgi:hypothetical protein